MADEVTDRDIKPEKIDLDALEKRARAAQSTIKPHLWYEAGYFNEFSLSSDTHTEDAAHIAANSPDVTLALIRRIRELEGLLATVADHLDATDFFRLTQDQIRAAIAKGTTR